MNFKKLRFDQQLYQFLDDFLYQIQLISLPEAITVLNPITDSE
jgi:hypothetical protein